MAVSNDVLAFMAKMSSSGGIVVQDQPKIDLELYVQNYAGRTRFDRLLLIGKSSVPLCVDALKGAVHEAKSGRDVSQYLAAWECLRLAAPNEPESQKDDAWIERVEAENKAETTRLESELKGYKNNLIKESIRMGHEDLGKHLENIGKLKEACDAYAKMRQDVSTSKHIADCAMHLALVSLYRKDYSMLLNNVGKMISARSGGEQDGKLQVYTRIASGIGLLEHCRYDEAAKAFLRIDFNIASSEYNHIASPNDIALYGGLLALATIDRKELQKEVLENPKFRTFLEHEPHIRKAISQFVNGRYSSCLAILEASRPDCLLDIYLQKHVPKIFSKIRSKCIVQYFIPFSCVTLESLDAAFAQPGSSLETELIGMIRQGALQARIDAKNKLLVAVRPDTRVAMQKEALRLAERYEREAKEKLRRMSLISAGLDAIGAKPPGTGAASASHFDEAWYDEDNGMVSSQGEVEISG